MTWLSIYLSIYLSQYFKFDYTIWVFLFITSSEEIFVTITLFRKKKTILNQKLKLQSAEAKLGIF